MGSPVNPIPPLEVEQLQGLKVGGKVVQVEAHFTRPADTTAYTAGDVVSNSTSATTLLAFGDDTVPSGVTDEKGGSALLLGAQLFTDNKGETAQYDLVLYRRSEASVSVPADNAPDTTIYADRLDVVGVISFPAAAAAADSTNSTGASAEWTGTAIGVVTYAGDKKLYGKLVNQTGTTPASGQNFSVRLTVLQN